MSAATPEVKTSPASEEKKKSFPLKEIKHETSHEISIRGKKLKYKAVAQTTLLKDPFGEPTGAVFTTAYFKEGVDKSKRPLIFIFNGGPGSGSAWLHLGIFGPKRVHLDAEGFPEGLPSRLVPNEFSLLPDADLVFVDPIGTGFSQPASDEAKKKFYGVKEDVESLSEVIRLFVSQHRRWTSPLYLAGESYGTTRVAGLVHHLQYRHGMYFQGVILISCILDFQTVEPTDHHALTEVLLLPSMAATSWYHRRLPAASQKKSLTALLQEVEAFIEEEYFSTLLRGFDLTAEEKKKTAETLHRFTGLTVEEILHRRLRVNLADYTRLLFEKEKKGVGRLDSRFLGFEPDYLTQPEYRDPSLFAIQGPYASCINNYLRDDLKVEAEQAYELLNFDVGSRWDWNVKNSFVDVSKQLRHAMIQNPQLKILVASGYYDFATPYYAALYNFRQLDLAPELRKNLSFEFYESGHMMYIQHKSLKKMSSDISNFLNSK